jgi:glycosyltransferase involved in cell wall biosynthesis
MASSTTSTALKIMHVGASDSVAGAARAAYRVHRSLVDYGIELGVESRFRVIQKFTSDGTVLGGPPLGQSRLWRRLHPRLNRLAKRGFQTGNPVLHSIAWPDTGLGKELEQLRRQQADLIHLHWLGDSTLSIEEIGRLPQPIVWRLPDQWAFSGAEHYGTPPAPGDTASSDERFIYGYPEDSRPAHESGPDLNRRTWLRKQRAWRRPINIVCTTSWLADCARRSALMKDWPISVIPNPLDLTAFAPLDQAVGRELHRLPQDRPLILFGALDFTTDVRKGADLFFDAIKFLRQQVTGTQLENLELVVFGSREPIDPPQLGFPVHWLGSLGDDVTLRLAYTAADVMVVPSRQEAFGQTASEAQACGTPVVAFRTGGLVDIVKDHVTGALADPFDPASLAESIRWVLETKQRRRQLAAAACQRADALFNPQRIAGLYTEVYKQALAV